jgi:hypothetical protein
VGFRAVSEPVTVLLFGAAIACGGAGCGATGAGAAADGGAMGGDDAAADDGASSGCSLSADAGVADGAAPIAFDESQPTPGHDCRSDTSANCISAAGTYNGVSLDEYCDTPSDLGVTIQAGKWAMGCNSLGPGFGRFFIPIREPGAFVETATAGSKPQTEFEFSADSTVVNQSAVALFSSNLVCAQIAGTVAVVSGPYRSISGTFHGEWTTPGPGCNGPYGSPCAPTNINVTFRMQTTYGNCLTNADCPSGQTCEAVAYTCQ